jgi:hypothetical protein
MLCNLMFEQVFVYKNDDTAPPVDLHEQKLLAQTLSMSEHGTLEFLMVFSPSCGASFAGRVLECDSDNIDESTARDAMGELLNIVAGQIKSSLGSSHAIGLPSAYRFPREKWQGEREGWSGRYISSSDRRVNIWLAVKETSKKEVTA